MALKRLVVGHYSSSKNTKIKVRLNGNGIYSKTNTQLMAVVHELGTFFLCLPLLLPKCDGMVIYCERDTFEQEQVYCSQCVEP